MPRVKQVEKHVADADVLAEMIAQATPITEARASRTAQTKEERSELMKKRLDDVYAGHEWQVVSTGYAAEAFQGSSGYRIKRYYVVQALDDPSEKRVAGRTELMKHATLEAKVPVIKD